MTLRERAEKYAEEFKFGWSTEERISFFEEIIKKEIAACVQVEKGIGNFFGILGHSMLDRILEFRAAIDYEREECAKIAENPIKIPDEPGKVNQHAWPGHPVMKAIAAAIRARGEESKSRQT